MTTIKSLLNSTTKKLQSTSPTPQLDAEILLSHLLNKPKEFLYANPDYQLSIPLVTNYQSLITRRLTGEPIAYLTGHKEFYGLNFYINKTVLIPRPETEILIEEILNATYGIPHTAYRILDIGTGSGCISVALAKNDPKLKIYASDICQQALKVAAKNAKAHNVKINFKHGNLLEPFKNIKLDAIVANLPYLDEDEYKGEPSIQFEPKKALVGGLKYFEELFGQIVNLGFKTQVNEHLKFIYLEIGDRQAKDLKRLVKKYLPQYKIKIKTDLAGRDRVLILAK